IYPLATSLFGSSVGYSPELENGLLVDTGVPWGAGLVQMPVTIWNSFFTAHNAVNAPWTPLVVMSLPWFGVVIKTKLGRFLSAFTILYLGGWLLISSSIRHASGGALILLIISAMAWREALKEN